MSGAPENSKHIREICWLDDEFPQSLASIKGAPKVIYERGVGLKPENPHLTIIGSRKIDQQTAWQYAEFIRKTINSLARAYASLAPTIVSCLVQGTDTVAHNVALAVGAPTVAVLPTAINRVRPVDRELAERIDHSNVLGTALVSTRGPIENGRQLRHQYLRAIALSGQMGLATVVIGENRMYGSTMTALERIAMADKPIFFLEGSVTNNVREMLIGKYDAKEVKTPRQIMDGLRKHQSKSE